MLYFLSKRRSFPWRTLPGERGRLRSRRQLGQVGFHIEREHWQRLDSETGRAEVIQRPSPPSATDVIFLTYTPFDAGAGPLAGDRGKAFNVSNTPMFSNPNVTFGSSAFGTIIGVQNSARVLQ